MQKQIDVAELGRRAAEVVDEVVRRQESYIVARDGEPEAVLVPYIEFLRWQRASGESADEHFEGVIERLGRLNAHWSEEEVARDVAEAIAEVRRGDP
jgi:prevent-host-death family protein